MLREAASGYEQAIHLEGDHADAHVNLAYIRFLLGHYQAGCSEYEWRWRRPGVSPPPSGQPLWDGSALQGRTILLFAEQGLGDTLQFIRYAPLVRQQGATVIVQCQSPLVRLLARCVGIDRVVVQGTAPPPHDLHAPLLSLPRIFGTTLATIPSTTPISTPIPNYVPTGKGN